MEEMRIWLWMILGVDWVLIMEIKNIMLIKGCCYIFNFAMMILLLFKFRNKYTFPSQRIIIDKVQIMADYQPNDEHYLEQRTPVQCRNGPLPERSCTDWFCCLIYILLIAAVVTLGVISSHSQHLDQQHVLQRLDQAQNGRPFLAIKEALPQILISLGFVAALSFLLVFTTFLIPSLVAYIYIPVFLILMLLASIGFFLRYFGGKIPLVNQQKQNQWASSKSLITLIIGICFLIGFITALITMIYKRGKFKNIIPVLQISKICFWENCYIILASFFFSILSIGALTINIIFLAYSQSHKSQQNIINPVIMGALIIVETLWTHGFLEALSDFFFSSIAVNWYFKRKREETEDLGCCSTLCETNKLTFFHLGTIVYGHLLAYIPETFNTMLGKCQQNCSCLYYTFCCLHRFTFSQLTKYCYIQTILQNLPFCPANQEMFGLRKRTKATLPEIYMMGNFYMTLAKIFIIMTALCLNYIILAQQKEHLMKHIVNVISPLIVTLLVSLEVSGHFMNTTGLIGDVITFMYTADLQIEKKHFGEMSPYSCPGEVDEIIYQIKNGEIDDYDN